MSCNRHCYESDIATLEQENKQMRARMERLSEENKELIKQVEALLLIVNKKDKE